MAYDAWYATKTSATMVLTMQADPSLPQQWIINFWGLLSVCTALYAESCVHLILGSIQLYNTCMPQLGR